jgi:hypothetical protein
MDGSMAVVLFNRNVLSRSISFRFSDLGLYWRTAKIRDLWKKENLGVFEHSFHATVPAKSAVMIKISKNQ